MMKMNLEIIIKKHVDEKNLTFPCIFDGANVNDHMKTSQINAVGAVVPLNSIFTCGRDGFVRQWLFDLMK